MAQGLDEDEDVIVDPGEDDVDANEKDPEVTEVGSKDNEGDGDLGM